MIEEDTIERPIYTIIEVVIIGICGGFWVGKDVLANDIDEKCVATLNEEATWL